MKTVHDGAFDFLKPSIYCEASWTKVGDLYGSRNKSKKLARVPSSIKSRPCLF